MTIADDQPRRLSRYRLERGTKISLGGLPTEEELANQPHKGEAADRFTLYRPDQIADLTRDVRLVVTFGDVIKVRDQMEQIIEAARKVIEVTRNHDIGSVRQRIEARQEAASLGRVLTRFNNRTPYGEKPKKRRAY